MNAPQLLDPNQSELDWVADHVAVATRLIDGDPDVDALDALWAAWLPDAPPEQANDMVHIVGLTFGQRLVDELGMRWVVATDQHGTEMALHHPQGNALLHPVNVVVKRWESRETGFLRPIYDEVARITRDA